MLTITLDEFVNGYTLSVFEDHKYLVREIHEEKIEALKALGNIVDNLAKKERYAVGNLGLGVIS